MQKNLLQKSLTILFTTFIGVFLFGGVFGGQNAYAAPLSVEEKTKACTDKGGEYKSDGTCYLKGQQDCKSLTGYEEKTKNAEGILCQQSATGAVTNPEQEKVLKERIYFIIEAQKWLNALIWPVLVMTGDLMNNNILFGAGMDERLREIWIPIRNLINLFFVLAMVGIAIYNILGVGDDNDAYSIKQILPKMIIAIIAVNFSFLGIKVFLDGINVLTTSIFALPDQVKDGLGDVTQNPDVVKRFCLGTMGKSVNDNLTSTVENASSTELDLATYKITVLNFAEKNSIAISSADLNALTTEAAVYDFVYNKLTPEKKQGLGTAITDAKLGRACTPDAKLTPRGEAFLKKYNSSNAALAMALNMSKIVFYQEIDITTLTEANISRLLTNTVFSVALYLIYVVSFLALFIVLLARLVVMWLGVVASPIIIVSMILPVFKEKLGFGDLVDKFVQNAIAPIMIAFAMTVGWIMLRAIQSVNILSSGSVTFGTGGIPVAGLNTVQDLIVALGTVGVIWMAVSSAANKSIAEPVTKALYGGLASAGSFVGGLAWKHAPLFPVSIPGQPDKMMMTPEILGQVMKDAKYKFQDKESDNAKAMSAALGLRGADEKRLTDLTDAKDTKDALGIMRTNYTTIKNGGTDVDGHLNDFFERDHGKFEKELDDRKAVPRIKEFKDMVDAFKQEKDEGKKKEIRGKMAEHLRQYGKDMEAALEKGAPAAGTEPKAKSAPYAFTEHSKVGGAEVADAAKAQQLVKATSDLTKALNDKKDEATLKPLIKQFETITGRKPLLAELKAFITDPSAQEQLKKVFHDDAGIQKAIDTASAKEAPGAAIPKGAVPEQAGKPQQELASAAPLPAQPIKPENPLEAPLVGQPPQVADAGNPVQPPQPNAGPSQTRPEEKPPVA